MLFTIETVSLTQGFPISFLQYPILDNFQAILTPSRCLIRFYVIEQRVYIILMENIESV